MKKFDISVTGCINPISKTYTIEAKNRKQAKKWAEEMFDQDLHLHKFNQIKIKTLWEYKEKK